MSKSLNISLRIVALFVVAIIVSFIPDYLHAFLGDFYCGGNLNLSTNYCSNGSYGVLDRHAPQWHWAYRHWLFAVMGFCLAVVQAVNIVNIISKD